ncbi:MAG: hypothetical protein KAX44_03715 [Candidatus Brocadiae bacterium]|nr:hypothetical protein [Candidatus Brocadiia bacterium]
MRSTPCIDAAAALGADAILGRQVVGEEAMLHRLPPEDAHRDLTVPAAVRLPGDVFCIQVSVQRESSTSGSLWH